MKVMRIPTKTKMIRSSKDSSPSSLSTNGSGSSSLHTTQSTTSTSSSSHSAVSGTVSLLREDLQVDQEFHILRTLNEGAFAVTRIFLASLIKDPSASKVVIKARDRCSTSVEDFNREVEMTYLLSPHPNVVTCYNVSFIWEGSFCFLQEYAVYGSLQRFLKRRRNSKGTFALGEQKTKLICTQIASALDFMHQLHLVHGQLTPENILVFKGNLSQVKLTNFSSSHSEGDLVVVKHKSSSSSCYDFFAAPELSDLLPQEKYHTSSKSDVWQLGILLFYLVQGKGPWVSADSLSDPTYRHYCAWLKRKNLKIPEILRPFSSRFVRLFKRLCEPKSCQRAGVRELRKYMKDQWLLKPNSILVNYDSAVVRKISDASTESATGVEINPEKENNEEVLDITTSLKKLGIEKVHNKDKTLREWILRSGEHKQLSSGELIQLIQ